MNAGAMLKNSLSALRVNRRRSALTMLGIVIGIAAVIIIMSVGAGAQSLIFNQITSIGTNLIGVLPGYSDEDGPPASAMGISVTTLNHGDALAIGKIDGVEAVASYVRGVETVSWGNQSVDATYVGTTAEYADVESVNLELGRFFDESDDKGASRVAVLGWQVWQDLFAGADPIGERIKIKRESFRVIGMTEKRGVQGFENKDTQVFIPLPTAQKIMLGIKHVSLIRAKVVKGENIDFIVAQTRQILRAEHGLSELDADDFSVRAAEQALAAVAGITNALSFFLAGIAAISLLVGGVSIMNIMLVAVNERTREIGLRKAVGATSSNIQWQFLAESVVVTLIGGVVGILIGVAVAGIIAVSARYLGYAWDFRIPIISVVLGVGVAGLVGVVFGWYPAAKASRLQPVEALRYE